MKSILKILGLLLLISAIVGAGYVVYIAFLKPAMPVPTTTKTASPGIVAMAMIPIKPIGSKPLYDYWVNAKTNTIYYLSKDGEVMKTFGDGKDSVVSKQTLTDFNKLIVSPDGTKIIAVLGYPTAPFFAVYDAAANTWERLPSGTISATFDPTSQKIAYLQSSATAGGLYTLNLADKKSVKIMNLLTVDGDMLWRNKDEILLSQKSATLAGGETWVINLTKKTLNKLTRGSAALMEMWGNDLGLKLVTVDQKFELLLVHSSGAELSTLPFMTIPSKCTFQGAMLYCAVPASLPVRANLPDDYFKEKIYALDQIISFDTNTRESKILFDGSSPVDAINLLVQDKQLLFKNRYDEKVYSLELK